jgi:hypothetical protein
VRQGHRRYDIGGVRPGQQVDLVVAADQDIGHGIAVHVARARNVERAPQAIDDKKCTRIARQRLGPVTICTPPGAPPPVAVLSSPACPPSSAGSPLHAAIAARTKGDIATSEPSMTRPPRDRAADSEKSWHDFGRRSPDPLDTGARPLEQR